LGEHKSIMAPSSPKLGQPWLLWRQAPSRAPAYIMGPACGSLIRPVLSNLCSFLDSLSIQNIVELFRYSSFFSNKMLTLFLIAYCRSLKYEHNDSINAIQSVGYIVTRVQCSCVFTAWYLEGYTVFTLIAPSSPTRLEPIIDVKPRLHQENMTLCPRRAT